MGNAMTVDALAATARAVAARQLGGRRARDGDCVEAALALTHAVQEAGGDARTVVMTGWADSGTETLVFAHHVTVVTVAEGGPTVVDVTGQQFDPGLPAVWVQDEPSYRVRLARAAGVAVVTAGWPGSGGTVGGCDAPVPPGRGRQGATLPEVSTGPPPPLARVYGRRRR